MYEWERRECISVKQLEAIKELLEKQMYKKMDSRNNQLNLKSCILKKTNIVSIYLSIEKVNF